MTRRTTSGSSGLALLLAAGAAAWCAYDQGWLGQLRAYLAIAGLGEPKPSYRRVEPEPPPAPRGSSLDYVVFEAAPSAPLPAPSRAEPPRPRADWRASAPRLKPISGPLSADSIRAEGARTAAFAPAAEPPRAPTPPPAALASPQATRTVKLVHRYYVVPPVVPSSGVSIEEKTEYYAVSGATMEEVSRDLTAKASLHAEPGDGSWVGLCQAEVEPRWRGVPREGGLCRVETAGVGLKITIVLPRWDGRGAAGIGPRFSAFTASVRTHEESHRAIAIQGANELAAALASLPEAPCAELGAAAEKAFQDEQERTRRRQADYHAAVQARGVDREF